MRLKFCVDKLQHFTSKVKGVEGLAYIFGSKEELFDDNRDPTKIHSCKYIVPTALSGADAKWRSWLRCLLLEGVGLLYVPAWVG